MNDTDRLAKVRVIFERLKAGYLQHQPECTSNDAHEDFDCSCGLAQLIADMKELEA